MNSQIVASTIAATS